MMFEERHVQTTFGSDIGPDDEVTVILTGPARGFDLTFNYGGTCKVEFQHPVARLDRIDVRKTAPKAADDGD